MPRFGACTALLSALFGCAFVSPSTGEIKAIEQQARHMRSVLTSLHSATAAVAEKGDTIHNLETADTSTKAASARLIDSMVLVTGIGQLSCQPAKTQDRVTCSYTVKLLRFGPALKEGERSVEIRRPQETTEVKQSVGFTRNAGKWTMDQR